jgi:hypothetical protein
VIRVGVKLFITTVVICKSVRIFIQLVCQYCPSKLIYKASCTRFQLVNGNAFSWVCYQARHIHWICFSSPGSTSCFSMYVGKT